MGLTNQIPSSRLAQAGVIPNTAARPASPYEGQMVYQQDTDQLLVWDGSAWYPPVNIAWGKMIHATSSTNYTLTLTQTIATGMSVTFNAVTNRFYKITYYEPQAQLTSTQTGATTLQIRQTSATGTLLNFATFQQAYSGGTYNQTMQAQYVGTLTAGSITIVGCAATNLTAGAPVLVRTSSPSFIIVEDIGPA